jgi:hypothetical protein
MERVFLQNKHGVIQPFITANEIKTLQEQHIAYETIKI